MKQTIPDLACYLCDSRAMVRTGEVNGYSVAACGECGYQGLHPQPSDGALADIYTREYGLLDGTEERNTLKRRTAGHYLRLLEAYRNCGECRGKLFEAGCGTGEFLAAAIAAGYEAAGVEILPHACEQARRTGAKVTCGDISTVPNERYDVVVMNDFIEHVRDPRATLKTAHHLLRPGGAIFLATPSLDSWSARLLGRRWMEFKPEHLHYFRRKTIELVLRQAGYERVQVAPGVKVLSLEYMQAHFRAYPVAGLGFVGRLPVPRFLARMPVKLVASGLIAMASKQG
jgi:SAM-dependent methyltransferase